MDIKEIFKLILLLLSTISIIRIIATSVRMETEIEITTTFFNFFDWKIE